MCFIYKSEAQLIKYKHMRQLCQLLSYLYASLLDFIVDIYETFDIAMYLNA